MKKLIKKKSNYSFLYYYYQIIACIIFIILSSTAKENGLDVQDLLPMFGRNSIERKVLDVTYSVNDEMKIRGESNSFKRDVHLLFDTATGRYREEIKVYKNPKDINTYRFYVSVWDGKEFLSLDRPVSENLGSRMLGPSIYEYPGHVVIESQPRRKIPSFAGFYYDTANHLFAKSVPDANPQLKEISEDTVTIETPLNMFEFSRKTTALKKVIYYWGNSTNERKIRKTYDCSNHKDCSDVWIPCRIIVTEFSFKDGSEKYRGEITVDPQKLRLRETTDDALFHETLPAGCGVDDRIRKKIYEVTTLDTNPPQDVEALQKMLDTMLEQAEEQKAAVEQEMKK
jgi:hypothetical protein